MMSPGDIDLHELTPEEIRRLGMDVSPDTGLLAVPVPRESLPYLRGLFATMKDSAQAEQSLVHWLQTAASPPRPAVASASIRVEQCWRVLEQRWGLLTGAEVGELRGSRAHNRSEAASALARAGKVVQVRRGGQARYPGCQFDEGGRPHPVMPQLVSLFSEAGWSHESVALWLAAPNGYLAQQCPADLLETRPPAVVDAAQQATADR